MAKMTKYTLEQYFNLVRTHQMKVRGLQYSCLRCAHKCSQVCTDHLPRGCVYFFSAEAVREGLRTELLALQKKATDLLHEHRLVPETMHQEIELLKKQMSIFTV